MPNDKYRTVVNRQHVRHRQRRFLLGIGVVALALAAGFFIGQLELGAVDDAAQQSSGSEVELQSLRLELDTQRVQHDLDVATLEMVRKEIAAQKEQISQLEEGLQFYKSLMAPEAIAQGLSLRKLELVATDSDQRFTFRLVAQQEALKHPLLKGSVSIEVYGQLSGNEVSYSIADISADIKKNPVALRFRYFQAVQGELILPEGFEPEGFRVVARASSPRKAEVREQFPWEVQGRFSYVGQ